MTTSRSASKNAIRKERMYMQTPDLHSLTAPAMATLQANNALLAAALVSKDVQAMPNDNLIAVTSDTLYVNERLFGAHSHEEQVYMLTFIALGLVSMHVGRRGNRDTFFWNIACDMALHLALEDLGVPGRSKMADFLVNPAYRNLTAEEIYDQLVEHRGSDFGGPLANILSKPGLEVIEG